VTLTLRRDGQVLDVTVVRDRITLPSVQSRLLDGDARLGYVRISIFAEPTARQLDEALGQVLEQGAQGIVLDLRSNPGGYVSSAVDVASAFVRDGVVLYQQSATDSQPRAVRTNGGARVPDLPVAVLVDGGSASAAEIVAASLRDNSRAVLVGQTTFGKGSVQELHTLSNDSRLRVTVAQWLTPGRVAIQGAGLSPDIPVAPEEGRDAALDAAVQYLSGSARG
jgi:carboxyl-terminal processing protease